MTSRCASAMRLILRDEYARRLMTAQASTTAPDGAVIPASPPRMSATTPRARPAVAIPIHGTAARRDEAGDGKEHQKGSVLQDAPESRGGPDSEGPPAESPRQREPSRQGCQEIAVADRFDEFLHVVRKFSARGGLRCQAHRFLHETLGRNPEFSRSKACARPAIHESNGVTRKILHRLLAVAALLMLLPHFARAGGEGSLDYVRSFLDTYPAFRAEGTMTTTMPPNRTYRCRVLIVFQKGKSMKFSYNTDASRDIIPYDYLYEDRKLTETIYIRDRSKVESTTDIGAPTRLVFGFVWDLIEAESNANLQGFIFNGLMSVEQNDLPKRTQIVLKRRLPGIPVEKAVFFIRRRQAAAHAGNRAVGQHQAQD